MGKPKELMDGALRSSEHFSRTHIQGLADLLNAIEREQTWPDGLNPIIALIPKEGAESEGQLRPISIIPYIYR
eukprot:9561965-Heterocapsa_arctica.AAC.1